MAGSVTFEVHLEDYYHGVVQPNLWHLFNPRIDFTGNMLLDALDRHRVKAVVYILGWVADHHPDLVRRVHEAGHVIGDHSYWHLRKEGPYRKDIPFRAPYYDGQHRPGLSGGFFFRSIPYKLLLRETKRAGILWLHPHDIDVHHPTLSDPILNLKRHWGVKSAAKKLDRLLGDVEWTDPAQVLEVGETGR